MCCFLLLLRMSSTWHYHILGVSCSAVMAVDSKVCMKISTTTYQEVVLLITV